MADERGRTKRFSPRSIFKSGRLIWSLTVAGKYYVSQNRHKIQKPDEKYDL